MIVIMESTGLYFFWLLDSDGNKVGERTVIKSVSLHQAIRNFRRRTGRKAADTRLNVDIEIQEERVRVDPSRIENVGGRGVLYNILPK